MAASYYKNLSPSFSLFPCVKRDSGRSFASSWTPCEESSRGHVLNLEAPTERKQKVTKKTKILLPALGLPWRAEFCDAGLAERLARSSQLIAIHILLVGDDTGSRPIPPNEGESEFL